MVYLRCVTNYIVMDYVISFGLNFNFKFNLNIFIYIQNLNMILHGEIANNLLCIVVL